MGKTLEKEVGERLGRCGLKLAVAESCTGGLLGGRITSVPGSSAWFAGGVISYANEIKTMELGVPRRVLAAYGAVSEPVAVQMAVGIRSKFRVDVALSITGIAGPDGGSAKKPVGLVYVGMADSSGCVVRKFRFKGTRPAVRASATTAALEMLLSYLKEKGE